MRGSSPRTPRGFTLIEISVVLFICGILITFALLSMGDRPLDQRQHTEAMRLEQLLTLAMDQAQLQSTQIGLLVGTDGYRFLYLGPQRHWTPFADGPLRLRKLPHPFELRLRIDRHAITAANLTPAKAPGDDATDEPDGTDDSSDGTPAAASSASKYPVPQILLLSSGEATAFKLDVVAPGHPLVYQLTGNDIGDVKLVQITQTP
ncbi:MAG TPA: type II secretion system protein [Nevskiaceae bacterium]|nr:type II secretion system protein [Nevskiaceae bacterium]